MNCEGGGRGGREERREGGNMRNAGGVGFLPPLLSHQHQWWSHHSHMTQRHSAMIHCPPPVMSNNNTCRQFFGCLHTHSQPALDVAKYTPTHDVAKYTPTHAHTHTLSLISSSAERLVWASRVRRSVMGRFLVPEGGGGEAGQETGAGQDGVSEDRTGDEEWFLYVSRS